MARGLGAECVVTIGGASAIAVLRGNGATLTHAPRKTLGGSTTTPLQNIIGYSVSNSAKSGISVDFKLPYGGDALLTNALNATPFTVSVGLGGPGGAQLTNCLCESLQVTGSEGGDIECSASFVSISKPTSGNVGTPQSGDYFKFSDVVSLVGPGINTNDISSFTFMLQRTIAEFHGNSPDGIAKYILISSTEASADVTYLKVNDGAGAIMNSFPVNTADVAIVLAGAPFFAGGPTTGIAFTLSAAFPDPYPTFSGNMEDFVLERSMFKSSTGIFTIS